MLDQLDDPIPFTPTPELVAAAKARGTRLRRRHRLGVTGAMIPVILVLALLAGAVYVGHRLDQVDRVDVAAGVLVPVTPGAPFNVLVVGTDGPRTGEDGESGRADTIMIVRFDRSAGRVNVVSLPRDLVFDEGSATTDRLSALLPTGGPEALISAIHIHLGIEISHFVEIDYAGFEKLIDAVGGVSLHASAPLRDTSTGLELDESCQHLDGRQALELARSSRVEYLTAAGVWQTEPSGDIGRVQRQQTILSLVFGQLHTMHWDPSTLSTLIDVFADNTTLDAGFDRSAILGLTKQTLSDPLPHVASLSGTIPFEPFTRPNGEVVLRATADAPRVAAGALDPDTLVTQSPDDTSSVDTLGDGPWIAIAGPPLVVLEPDLGQC